MIMLTTLLKSNIIIIKIGELEREDKLMDCEWGRVGFILHFILFFFSVICVDGNDKRIFKRKDKRLKIVI